MRAEHLRFSKPYFTFPPIAPSEGFAFEKLSTENFAQLYLLFEGDTNPFTDERFITYEGAKAFAEERERFGAYSAKHGGQDWLFRRSDTGEYLGILHLYDMSLEKFGDNNKRCWLGFAAKPTIRGQGVTKKAARVFISYIFESYPVIDYIHAMIMKENSVARNFLRSIGFQNDADERQSKEHDFFVLSRIC